MNNVAKLRYGFAEITSFSTCLFGRTRLYKPTCQCVSSSAPLCNKKISHNRLLSHNNKNSKLAFNKDEDWHVIYKLPTIKYIRLVSRVKIYQILLMGCFCYPLYVQYTDNLISSGLFYSAIGGCIGTSLVFIVFSYFATRITGQLAVDKKQQQLRISRLNFYGTRCNDIISLDNVIPWADVSTDEDLQKTFQRLYLHDGDKEYVYLYSLKYGQLVDSEMFEKIIGIS